MTDTDYKSLYKSCKRKLKILLYENELYQLELRKAQKLLIDVERDKSFLLDRILQFTDVKFSSDSEETEDSEEEKIAKDKKKRQIENSQNNSRTNKRKKTVAKKFDNSKITKVKLGQQVGQCSLPMCLPGGGHSSLVNVRDAVNMSNNVLIYSDETRDSSRGYLSSSEIERQLASRPRRIVNDLSTTVSMTLPNQLFSDHPVFESDAMENETSPSIVGDEVNSENNE